MSYVPVDCLGQEAYRTIRDFRDILIEHLDDKAIPLCWAPDHTRRRRLIIKLINRKLLKGDGEGNTLITIRGRDTLAAMLGDWADAIVANELVCIDRIKYNPDFHADKTEEVPKAKRAAAERSDAALASRLRDAAADRGHKAVPA